MCLQNSFRSGIISSFAKHKNKNQEPDGRRDTDADYGKKRYTGIDKEGKAWEKVISWFGYKLHLIVDAAYELPVLFSVSKASVPDINEGRKLMEEIEHRQLDIMETCQKLTADKGYDDTKFITNLWDNHQIKPVIDIRNMWKDPDKTRLLTGQTNVTYNYKGNVYCHCPKTGKEREMSNGGFEKDRNNIKKAVYDNLKVPRDNN